MRLPYPTGSRCRTGAISGITGQKRENFNDFGSQRGELTGQSPGWRSKCPPNSGFFAGRFFGPIGLNCTERASSATMYRHNSSTTDPASLMFGTAMARLSTQPEIQTDPIADEELLRRFVENQDRGSFECLMRRYQHEIYNYLRRYLGDDDLAEDAFQLAFLRVYQKADQFDLSRRFRPWLYSVATNQAIDLNRRNKRSNHQSLDISSPHSESRASSQAASIPDHRVPEGDPLVDEEFRQRMRAAVGQIGEPGRSALELIYLQGLPYRDAAEVLDVPVGTVKSRVHAAIRKLSAIWQRNTD